MPKYSYNGPVMEFNTLLTDSWRGETTAPSERKARSNHIIEFFKLEAIGLFEYLLRIFYINQEEGISGS